MTFWRLLWRNLFFHWRGNLAVVLGVAVGAAVLTGALLVGDSLRGSLRRLAEEQLGWVDVSLTAGRFFRAELAEALPGNVAPAILLRTSAVKQVGEESSGPRVRQVVLLGVNERFWMEHAPEVKGNADFWKPTETILPSKRGVVLGAPLANDLGVQAGDRVTFYLQQTTAAPRESVLGHKDAAKVTAPLTLTVAAILPGESFGSRFNLQPGPTAPRNAYVPLRVLQEELWNQSQHLPKQSANSIFVDAGRKQASYYQPLLQEALTLEDLGLRLERPKRRFGIPAPNYLSLDSPEMFLPDYVEEAVKKSKLTYAPTLVYLVNNLSTKPDLIQVPYCVVCALDPTLDPPLGRFLPKEMAKLADDEILLVDWEGSPLKDIKPGEPLTLTFFAPEQETGFREETVTFKLAAHLPIQGPTNDPYLTPQFPGITNMKTIGEWEPPFPFDKKRIKEPDNLFWRDHRTTPKAYITLAAGEKLWGSRFGKRTSFRIVPPLNPGKAPTEADQKEAAKRILTNLNPADAGLVFENVKGKSLVASGGSQDFGMLFLGFSFFLIVAGLLLVGLLFRLNIDRRGREIGLLLAVGWPRAQIRWLLLFEGCLLALAGAALGCGLAVGYADLLLGFLASRWPGGLERSFLRLDVTITSLLIGYLSAVLVSALTILWALRVLARLTPTALVRGVTEEATDKPGGRKAWWVIAGSLVGAVGCFVLGLLVTDQQGRAGSFLGSGALLLTAGLALAWTRLRTPESAQTPGQGWFGLAGLGVRNTGRHPVRSLLTMGLLASAAFLIVAVQAFHRDASGDFLDREGGSGGFPLVGESDIPVFQDLNGAEFRSKLTPADQAILKDVHIYSLRVSAGADASCLNLYKPTQPRLVGLPPALVQRGGFRFSGAEERLRIIIHLRVTPIPWDLLEGGRPEGPIPVFGETNTVGWGLKSGLSGEIAVTDERGNPVKLRFVGLLKDSVFQGELLMTDANFRKLFPSQQGFKLFLIDAPRDQLPAVRSTLEKALAPFGFAATPSVQRLEQFLAVENTYLATFQALGGLGLLLGVLGLAVVLLRSAWERRGELALLRALGFRNSAIGWLVLAENLYLLALGLAIGTGAALLSVAPQLLHGAEVQWLALVGLLALVVLAGATACLLATASAVRGPVLAALRRE